jgi:hypothetical protein
VNETTWKWLIVGGIVAVVLAYVTLSKLIERRRRTWVDALAHEFATTAVHDSDATSHFEVTIDERRCELAQGYRSRTTDGRYMRGSGLVVTVALRGVSDIYNLSLKRSGEFANYGFEPRADWVTDGLRAAIDEFHAPLHVQGGTLVFVTYARMSGPELRVIVERQLAAAKEIEPAL